MPLNFTADADGDITVYNTSGAPAGTLTVVNGSAVSVTATPPPLPVAAFTFSPQSGTEPLTVQFTDGSQNATAWAWDFGDGGNSALQSPSHQFTAGTFTVTLTASNAYGSDQVSHSITVSTVPQFTDLVESWPLNEASDGSASVVRNGTQPTTPAINPARINLLDPFKALGSGGAAHFTGAGLYVKNETTSAAGAKRNTEFIGGGPSYVQFDAKWDSFPGTVTIIDRYQSYTLQLLTFPKNLKLISYQARTGLKDTVTSSVELQAARWYTIKFGYDGAKVFVEVTDDTGHMTRNETTAIRRNVFNNTPITIGGNGSGAMEGWMKNASFHRFTLDPGPCPLANMTTVSDFETTANRNTAGLYYYRPFPLQTWNPTLAAQVGNYVWCHSTDHGAGGIWQGFSNSPTVRPASWTLVWPGSGTITGQSYSSMETPHLLYVPGDANGRPFYLYGHAEIARSGVTNSQQTCLRTSADLVTWIDEGIVIPSQANSPTVINHTGYCTVYSTNELPNITGYHAYHLGNDTGSVTFCSPSSNPKAFNTLTNDPEELDPTSRFPAGCSNVEWQSNLFSPDGIHVYGIGRGWGPGCRGVFLIEMAQENSQWRQPTGKIWPLVMATDVYPTLGYIQDARAFYESGKVRLYILRGFYPQNGDERVDLVTFDFVG